MLQYGEDHCSFAIEKPVKGVEMIAIDLNKIVKIDIDRRFICFFRRWMLR
jgi:hypothetical protein